MKSRSKPPSTSGTKTQEEILRYHALIDNMNEGFCVVDLDSKIVYVNKRFCGMFGYTTEDMFGRDVHEFLDKRNSGIFDKHNKKRARGLPSQYELEWITKTGRVLPTLVSGAPLVDTQGVQRGSFAVVCDLTERRKVEDASKASEAKYRALAEEMTQGLVIVKDDRYVYANKAFAEMLGYSPKEIVDMSSSKAWSLVQPEDQGILRQYGADRRAGKKAPSHYRYRLVARNGSTHWVEAFVTETDFGGSPALQVLLIDVTERVERDEAFLASEAKYRALAEQSSQGIMIIGDEGFAYINKAFAQMVGYSVDELMRKNMIEIWDLIHPEDQPVVMTQIQNLFARRAVPPRYQYRLVRKDGEICWVEAFSGPIQYEGKQAIQTMIVDVTERLRVERATGVTKDRASFYLDVMGHDLKNQLQVVVNSAALLRIAQDDSRKSSLLEVIENAVQRCSRLIEEVRATEQLMSIPLAERPLNVALKGCVQAISSRVTDAVFEAVYEVDDAWIYADGYLELLLSNILVNAVEHNPSSDKHVWVGLKDDGQFYVVSISDNGPGIPDSSKAILFDPARRFGGMGIHQSNQIIEKYRGKIDIVDRVVGHQDMGAEFRIWFPKAVRSS
ncbi:MAG: hypothetical protein C4K47_04130 [Candidatus Thorarchaeota archaeon]|nr:MAG: hypothetical protein C4K47_04130 [Candidatus Thorarchaeota archaeon]